MDVLKGIVGIKDDATTWKWATFLVPSLVLSLATAYVYYQEKQINSLTKSSGF